MLSAEGNEILFFNLNERNINNTITLPDEITMKIGLFLEAKYLSAFSRSCKRAYGFFNQTMSAYKAETLLKSVIENDSKKTKEILNSLNHSYIVLMKLKAKSKDDEWESISVLEYVIWIGNFKLLEKLLIKISTNHVNEMREQIKLVLEKGINGKACFPLINSLIRDCNELRDNLDGWDDARQEEMINKIKHDMSNLFLYFPQKII